MNVEVASLHVILVAETVDHVRKEQELTKRVRYVGSHRRGISDGMVQKVSWETGETLGVRRRNPVER